MSTLRSTLPHAQLWQGPEYEYRNPCRSKFWAYRPFQISIEYWRRSSVLKYMATIFPSTEYYETVCSLPYFSCAPVRRVAGCVVSSVHYRYTNNLNTTYTRTRPLGHSPLATRPHQSPITNRHSIIPSHPTVASSSQSYNSIEHGIRKVAATARYTAGCILFPVMELSLVV